MDKRRRTPNKRNQPSRQTRAQAGGVEDVLLDVLQELKTLKEEVKDLKERQNSTEANQKNQDTSTTSTVQPSSSEARSPVGANESESKPMHISPTAQGPSSPLAFMSHTPSALSQVAQVPSSTLPLGAQVPSSSLPLMDIVPEQMRQDIIRELYVLG